MRTTLPSGWMVLLGVLTFAVPLRAQEVKVVCGERQLFLDDLAVDKIVNLKRVMHSPDKKGAVIRGPQTRSAPAWDPQTKRYYLSTLGGVFQSVDGLQWTPTSDKMPRIADCVIYDRTEKDPARRYKAILTAHGGRFDILLGPGVAGTIAGSKASFQKVVEPFIESADEWNFSFDEKDHLYILTLKQFGPYGRTVWLSTSTDFTRWTKPEMIFHADELDQQLGKKRIRDRLADPHCQRPVFNDPKDYNVDVYNMGVFRYEGLYIGMPAVFHATGLDKPRTNKDGFHLIQLACSRDLKHWQRVGDRRPFIDLSPLGTGAYDRMEMIGPSFPVYKGDELWFYYTGIKYRDIPEGAEADAAAVCLATLRRDGFVSLDAGGQDGTVQTKPFVLPAGNLHLNVDAFGGSAVVHVCGENGSPISGFESSTPISVNRPDTVVTWPKGEWKSLAGKKVALRVTLRKAKLYSYWVQ